MIKDPLVLKKYLSEVFVETGTSRGDGVQTALDCGFRAVQSIEIVPALVKEARERFKDNERVHIHEGDSLNLLPGILEELPRYVSSATFWLDAHVNSYKDKIYGKCKCPVLPELELILKCPLKKIVMIDDMRLFRNGGKKRWDNVVLEDILLLVHEYPGLRVSYEDGFKKNDIMVIR